MDKISVTRALVELKLLDKRIKSKLSEAHFIGMVQGKKDLTTNLIKIDDFKQSAKSDFQSIQALIERRNKIKAAIVLSNATTQVKIGDKAYTVAEAIERKNSIQYEESLLNLLRAQRTNVEKDIHRQNQAVEEQLNVLLAQHLASEKKKSEDAETFMKSYKELNEFKKVDPLDIKKTISELREQIEIFKAEVDLVLSETNANSFIEIQ